jgi:hypothetical protein
MATNIRFGFQDSVDVACAVENADDVDATVGWAIENQMPLESLHPPDTQPVATGHRPAFADAGHAGDRFQARSAAAAS